MFFSKKSVKAISLLSIFIFALGCNTILSSKGHWDYDGQQGPKHWGKLSPDNTLCTEGKNQSPIHLSNFQEAKLNHIPFDYKVVDKYVEHHGHAIQVDFASGNNIEVDNHNFELKQVHFHTPSEHQIEGKSFPMEAHFVHADQSGNLAVIGVMFDIGAQNKSLSRVLKVAPKTMHNKVKLGKDFSPMALLPSNKSYYRYNGSLTTPPCTEGVRWLIMKQPSYLSSEQLEKLRALVGNNNNRPLMDINARPVLK